MSGLVRKYAGRTKEVEQTWYITTVLVFKKEWYNPPAEGRSSIEILHVIIFIQVRLQID